MSYKFETLQLHVGQEQADLQQIQGQFRFIRPLHTFFTIHSMQQTASVLQMRVIFTAD